MAVAAQIVEVIRLRRCADAHAGLSARHIVEAVTIQTANLHVLDRLGLDGKIGGLRPSNRNHTGCGAEEKTFHHLHLNLQVPLSGGFRLRRRVHCGRYLGSRSTLSSLTSPPKPADAPLHRESTMS